MAEDLLRVRREERRRKILENANRRLQKLSNLHRSNEEIGNNAEGDLYNDIPNSFNPENVNEHENSNHTSISQEHEVNQFVDSFVDPKDSTFILKNVNSRQGSERHLLQSIIRTRAHLILLGLFVRMLYYFSYDHLFGGSLFVPFFTMEMGALIITKNVGPAPNMINIARDVVLLCGVSPKVVRTIFGALAMMLNLLEHFCIYFVAFISTSIIIDAPG